MPLNKPSQSPSNGLLKKLALATTLLVTVAPAVSAQAEQMTDAQRACVQRVLKNPNADTNVFQQCLTATEVGNENADKQTLAPDSLEAQTLFATLEARFSKGAPYRPDVVKFADVKKALEAQPNLLYSLNQMEKTGGQPDVIAVEGDIFVFADVSEQSPEGRRNLNYDEAKAMMEAAGYEMMDVDTYRELQKEVKLDNQSWSWLLTDAKTRASGYALNGDRVWRDDVGVGRILAVDRYSGGGFRGLLRVPKS